MTALEHMTGSKDDPRIEEIFDERDIGNGYFVYLKHGFAITDANTSAACHCFAEDTKAEVRRSMRLVTPCACAECSIAAIATKPHSN